MIRIQGSSGGETRFWQVRVCKLNPTAFLSIGIDDRVVVAVMVIMVMMVMMVMVVMMLMMTMRGNQGDRRDSGK